MDVLRPADEVKLIGKRHREEGGKNKTPVNLSC